MTTWVPLASLILALLSPLIYHAISIAFGQGDVKRWRAGVEQQIDKHARHHAAHFEHIGNLESSLKTLEQIVKGHEELDTERFGRIEELLKENRDDIKEVLRSLNTRQ